MTKPNPITEHSAQIAPPGSFDPSSFRSVDIHPRPPDPATGVRMIVAKRPGIDTTEPQALHFSAAVWTQRRAKAWLRRNGFRWRKWGKADPQINTTPATPNVCEATTNAADPTSTARLHVREASAHLYEAAKALGATNPADLGGLILAAGVANKAIGDVIEKHKHNPPAPATPGTPAAAPAPNPPAPRQLVQIGTARALELVSGRGYRWTVAERWLVLADPGAEKGSRGRLRLFIVAPKGKKQSTREPHKTAERTFETWHSFEPSRTWTMDIPLADEFTTPIGNARSITYRSDKWNHGSAVDYIHAFSKAQPPRVSAVGPADRPRALMLDGGRWRLTARGLVD
jgi:hypothetical protein